MAAIVLGALRGIGQDNRASTMARLQAWDQRQVQRLERKAQRQGRAVTGSARRADLHEGLEAHRPGRRA